MSRENSAGLTVNNHYGPRSIPDSAFGSIKTEGAYNEMTIEFSGANVNNGTADTLDTTGLLPEGSYVTDVFLEVEEVFSLTGNADNVLEVGTQGSEDANGVTLIKTHLEAEGVYHYDQAGVEIGGDWGSRLAADTVVSMILFGTNQTMTDAGKARVVIRYIKV
jgi:hypothetical protein